MNKQRIVISGASTGIGRACAARFAELGYTVFAGVRASSDGSALEAEIRGDLRPILLDVTLPASIQSALAAIGGEPLAGLVNNAGIAVVGPLELVPIEDWRRQFEVNVLGLVAMTQAFLPLLRAGRGRIVNIGSIAGRIALPGSGAYDSSKFAVEAITDALRLELASSKIPVSIIEPGSIATPIWQKSIDGFDALSRRVSPERYPLYAPLMAKIKAEAEQAARRASPVRAVVKAVEHAMISDKPKTRYPIGSDTRFWLMLNLLPDKWRDWLILKELNR